MVIFKGKHYSINLRSKPELNFVIILLFTRSTLAWYPDKSNNLIDKFRVMFESDDPRRRQRQGGFKCDLLINRQDWHEQKSRALLLQLNGGERIGYIIGADWEEWMLRKRLGKEVILMAFISRFPISTPSRTSIFLYLSFLTSSGSAASSLSFFWSNCQILNRVAFPSHV